MLEYILQITFLFGILFVYMLAGAVVYSATGEGYKATPLRCFAVGLGLWILLVVLSTVFFNIKLEYLWWIYLISTFAGLFVLPKKDQDEALGKEFFLQVLSSFAVVAPILFFLQQDKLHLWQEFAIYGKGLFLLTGEHYITGDFLQSPIAYQLAILPLSYFTILQENIFACFNIILLAFVACEFVRNSGVKIRVGNIFFPLIVSFALLVLLNPFSVFQLSLSADPFIFVCAIGFAFAEYIFRAGHLPKTFAAIPPSIILMLLAFSSTQGFLLSCSLLLVLALRYIIQFKQLNHKQLLGFCIIPLISVFVTLLWHFYLNKKGLGFLPFDINLLTWENIELYYKATWVLAKHNLAELVYILVVLGFALLSFVKVKKTDDLIVDKLLLKPVFSIVIIYMFICLPIFFSQYDKVARASFSLGFTSIALIQFIILMPVGRLIKETLNKLELGVSRSVKITAVIAMLVVFVMNKQVLNVPQDIKVQNMLEISNFMQSNIKEKSKIAVFDVKKSGVFYKYILDYKNYKKFEFAVYSVKQLPKGLKQTHQKLMAENVEFVLLHAPNNILKKSLEFNFNPNYSYLYKINEKGFDLVKKFENNGYRDTNIVFSK